MTDPLLAGGTYMIPEHRFESWDHFKSKLTVTLFGEGAFERGRYLFRGQRDPDWQLISTFDRMFFTQSKQKKSSDRGVYV